MLLLHPLELVDRAHRVGRALLAPLHDQADAGSRQRERLGQLLGQVEQHLADVGPARDAHREAFEVAQNGVGLRHGHPPSPSVSGDAAFARNDHRGLSDEYPAWRAPTAAGG